MERHENIDFKTGRAKGYADALAELTAMMQTAAALNPDTAEHTRELLEGLRAVMLQKLTELAQEAAAS